MFQIFDCNGRAVGRPAGYARHATAVALAERRGRIKSTLRAACDAAPVRPDGRQLLYRVAELPAGLPPERRGTAMGFFLMATGLATLDGSLAAGLAWDLLGPSAPFLLGGSAALLAVAAAPLLLRRK